MQDGNIKTVLITGANGFIGSRVCGLLAASGYVVRILCRETSDLSLLKDIPHTKFIGDITKPETLPAAITGVDYIIHLAGLVKANTKAAFFQVNQGGTATLLNAVKNTNLDLKKFVLVSSAAASGPSSKIPRKESDPPYPITTYGRSKLAAEEALTPFYDLFPITVIRPPAVYGPGDKEILAMFEIVNRGLRPYMKGGHNLVQMVFVDDLARGIKDAMESDRSAGETYFLAEAETHTVREMMNIMADLLKKKGVGIYIPLWLLNILAFVSEFLFKLIGKTAMFSREKVRELTDDWAIDVSKARDHLGFETAVDFVSGAKTTIDWYRQEGWLK